LPSAGRFGWFVFGLIIGLIVFEVFNAIVRFVPSWLRSGASVVGFLIQLVAWFGLMLAVIGVLGSRVIRKDEVNYLLVGFGAIIITLQLFLAIP